jgi:hypothetical protein
MNRLNTCVALGSLAVALFTGITVPASAAATPNSAIAVVAASPANSRGVAAATSAHASATRLRQDVGVLLNRYLGNYGDRLSPTEKVRMRFLIEDADRQLGIVEKRTATATRLASSGASRVTVYRSATSAEIAFTTAHARALATLDEVQPMLQSKLGLLEAIAAKGDLDEQMARYDALGAEIRMVSAAYRPSAPMAVTTAETCATSCVRRMLVPPRRLSTVKNPSAVRN